VWLCQPRTSHYSCRCGELALRAERKSPQTVKSYGDGVRRFLAWAADNNRPPVLDRATVAAFVADLLDAGADPATARARHLSLRRFSAWLVEEGETDENRLLGSKSPRLHAKLIEPLTDDELRTLIKVCAGPDMRDRRDEAP
jgi:integrase/recombinase XerD